MEANLSLAVVGLVGVLIGACLVMLLRRRDGQRLTEAQGREQAAIAEVGRLRQDLAVAEDRIGRMTTMEAELKALRADYLRASNALAEKEATVRSLERDSAQAADFRNTVDKLKDDLEALRIEHKVTCTTLEEERKAAAEKLKLLVDAKDRMAQEFKVLSNELLKQHGETFAKQNKDQIDGLLTPLKERISEFQKGLEGSQKESAKERAALGEQIKALTETSARMSNETTNLTRALKGKAQTQGAWGEMILSTILSKSGLREGEEYEIQISQTNDEGARLRPDVIVRLPEKQRLIIDAKVSLTAFEEYVNAEDDATRQASLTRHVASLRNHIKILASKEYHRLTADGPDYVVMFVPIEGAAAAAFQHDQSLIVTAADQNVMIATPTNLMMVLRTVASIWHIERRNRNADEIARRAGLLFDKFVGFVKDMQDVGAAIKNADEAHSAAMGKLSTGKGNLARQAEMLKALGARTGKSLPGDVQGALTSGLEDDSRGSFDGPVTGASAPRVIPEGMDAQVLRAANVDGV